MPDVNTLSKEELGEYFRDYEVGKRGRRRMSLESTDMEGLPATPKIKTRKSRKCDVEMELSSFPNSSTDSATLEVYEKHILIASYKMYHSPKIVLEIDDANEYKYKIIPLGHVDNPTCYFQVRMKYGSHSGSNTHVT